MPDLKITQLTEETSPVGADLLAIVDDVAGTPVTKKCTLTNLATLMGTLAGGVETFTSAHASPPASPSAGDLWLPNNSFYAYRYSGSVWVPWGPIFPMTPPVDADFSWVNQGTATVTTTNGGIYLTSTAAGGNNVRMRVKSAPATPYTITAGFLAAPVAPQYLGIGFRQTSDGKLVTLDFFNDGSAPRIGTSNWNGPTSYQGATATLQILATGLIWFRIQDNGTNRISSYSYDGQNWLTILTEARTAWITADQIMFWINENNGTYAPRMTLLSWKET